MEHMGRESQFVRNDRVKHKKTGRTGEVNAVYPGSQNAIAPFGYDVIWDDDPDDEKGPFVTPEWDLEPNVVITSTGNP